MENKKRHLIEYSLVFLVSLTFLFLFIFFKSNKDLLKVFSVLISISYILWGIIHSAFEGRLTKIVAFEYILFGALVFSLFFFALSF